MKHIHEMKPNLDYDLDSAYFLETEKMYALARALAGPDRSMEWLSIIVGADWKWLSTYGADLLAAADELLAEAMKQYQVTATGRTQQNKERKKQQAIGTLFPQSQEQSQVQRLIAGIEGIWELAE